MIDLTFRVHSRSVLRAVLPAFAIAVAVASGCNFRDGDARVYPVFGFGFVRVAEPEPVVNPETEPVQVRKTQAIGILAGPNPVVGGLMVGATTRQEVIVPSDAEVLVTAISFKDGGFAVEVDNIRPDGSSIMHDEFEQDPPDDAGGDS